MNFSIGKPIGASNHWSVLHFFFGHGQMVHIQTKALAETIASSSAYSLAGGGDTIAAIEMFGIEQQISYISTAGGAFLEFLEGKALPAVTILEQRA